MVHLINSSVQSHNAANKSNPGIIIRRVLHKVLHDLVVVLADVLGVPAVAAVDAVGEGGLLALDSHVAAAHDRVPQVLDAVRHVPNVAVRRHHVRHVGLDCGHPLGDAVQAVQLVRDRCCEGRLGVGFQWVR